MFLSKVSIQRPVTTWVMVIVLAILGALAYVSLPMNFTPDVDFPVINVQVIYPGAGAEEIENNITKKIEDEIGTISELDDINSYIMEGVTIVTAQFKLSKDGDLANQEVKDKVENIINDFPSGAEAPVITKFEIGSEPVSEYSFVSNLNNVEAYDYVDQNLKPRLSRLSGVADVEIKGGQKREIHVVLNSENLQKYEISPMHIIAFLQQNNLNLPGGNIKKNGYEYSVKFEGEFKSLRDIENIRLNTPKGERKLKELAKIKESSEEIEDIGRFYNLSNTKKIENTSTINISIIKLSEANAVEVAELVKEEIESIKKDLQSDMNIELARDSSVFVKDSISDTMSSIILGILFTALVLYFFLHDIRSTLVVAISMPVVLIATFLLMRGAGFTLNIMSLMGMSVSVGTLVTNSVVILENIDRYIKMGMNKKEASDRGTAEIAVAVLASTLTNIVVFVPIATMNSMVGQFFKEFGLTVVFIMLFSIFISFTLTPMLASQIIKDNKKDSSKKKRRRFDIWFENQFNKITNQYEKVVSWLVKTTPRRISTIVGSFVLLILVFMTLGSKIGQEFVPYVDNGEIRITIEFPPYYEIEKTSSTFLEIENRLKEYEDVEKIIVNIGSLGMTEGSYVGEINVLLKSDRNKSTAELSNLITKNISNIPDAILKVSKVSQFGSGDSPIQVEILGPELKNVQKLTKQVYDIAKTVEGATNVDTDIREGKPEINITPKREVLSDYGMNVYDIAMILRANIEGFEASKYRIDGEEYDIKVMLDDLDIEDIDEVKNITIITPKGIKKISDLAYFNFKTSPTMIYRKNKLIMHKVTADIGSRTLGEIIGDIQSKVNEEIDIPEEYEIKQGGDAEYQREAMVDMGKAFLLAVVLTFLLIVAILESWSQGVFILMTVPLSMIGVVLALVTFGVALNVLSMMAIVMLIGIVVNNAIIILDYANHLQRNGLTKIKAIVEASHTKLRAIVMATLAAVLGMMPLALGLGSGAEMRQGVGVVSMGGLLISAILTLFVIPALYVQFTRENKDTVNTTSEEL